MWDRLVRIVFCFFLSNVKLLFSVACLMTSFKKEIVRLLFT